MTDRWFDEYNYQVVVNRMGKVIGRNTVRL